MVYNVLFGGGGGGGGLGIGSFLYYVQLQKPEEPHTNITIHHNYPQQQAVASDTDTLQMISSRCPPDGV